MKHLHRMQFQLIYKGIAFLFLMTFLAGIVKVMEVNALNIIDNHSLDSSSIDFRKNYHNERGAFLLQYNMYEKGDGIVEHNSGISLFKIIENNVQNIFHEKIKQQKMTKNLFNIILLVIGIIFYIMRLVYKRKNKRAPKIISEFYVDDSWEKIFDTAYSNKWKKELELVSSEEEEFFEDEEDYEGDEQDDKDLPTISEQKDKKEVVEKRSQYSGFDDDAQAYNKKFGTPWWSGKKKD